MLQVGHKAEVMDKESRECILLESPVFEGRKSCCSFGRVWSEGSARKLGLFWACSK